MDVPINLGGGGGFEKVQYSMRHGTTGLHRNFAGQQAVVIHAGSVLEPRHYGKVDKNTQDTAVRVTTGMNNLAMAI